MKIRIFGGVLTITLERNASIMENEFKYSDISETFSKFWCDRFVIKEMYWNGNEILYIKQLRQAHFNRFQEYSTLRATKLFLDSYCC